MCVSACLMMWLMAAPLSLTMWWRPGGSGVPRVGLASQQWGFITHTHHTMHEAVLAPGPGLLTQVPAIVRDPFTLLGALLPGLNSKLVNGLLSIPWGWVSRYLPWRVGVERESQGLKVKVCVCVCVFDQPYEQKYVQVYNSYDNNI